MIFQIFHIFVDFFLANDWACMNAKIVKTEIRKLIVKMIYLPLNVC